ncbi:hypothetical protein DES40_2154 [Litorimonas taeanensis]|uniref:Uncharacterized protein n=1 Tax=Litorimonas taeanensis TaxID=568099 RepID=A0A420WEA5_9PROT|nr:hypothetical protein [Litorimonas taeanensis]RKQ69354.1 hypothetical protein DES40_2154 [Litorimonas taeanensis]
MILRTRSETLAILLAKDGGKCPHLQAVRDAIILAQAEAECLPQPENVGNDRTGLKHQNQI